MSDMPSSKGKKVDFILLGSAAILFLGLFLFSGSDDHGDEGSHGSPAAEEQPATTSEEASESEVPATQSAPVKAAAVKVKPAIVQPNAVPGTPLVEPTIESRQKENAELKAKYNGLRQRIRESLDE